ncbi:MAG: hypothetical protein K0R28_1965 [Paenibacillus sp.]|jgi:hypothetical protein|nr:hypothetical protein [Paenibacillus sp.]
MENLLSLRMNLLLVAVFLFWSIAYLLIIWRSFRDRTCGMPFAALCANIMWEFAYLFVFTHGFPRNAATAAWLALDCVILVQFVIYSRGIWSSTKFKYSVLAFSLLIAFLVQVGASIDFNDPEGKYTGFGINLMMSILFISMLLSRGNAGQSMSIGYAKMLGTFCASIVFYTRYPESVLLTMLYVLILLLDIIYIYLLYTRPGKPTAIV